jgi:hypothetical protein
MPYTRFEKIDTSSWGVKEWRSARLWNAWFLLVWMAFSTFVVIEVFRCPDSWPTTVPATIFLAWGFISQVVDLIRTTLWLRKQESPDQSTAVKQS